MDTLMLFEKIASQGKGALAEKLAADIVAMVYKKLAGVKSMAPEFAVDMYNRLVNAQRQGGRPLSLKNEWVQHLLGKRELNKNLASKITGATSTPSAAGIGAATLQSGSGSLKLRPEALSGSQEGDRMARLLRAQRMYEHVQQGSRY